MDLSSFLSPLPLVAILRGVRPDEVEAIGDALVENGFRILEVPLNSPEPLLSIERLARRLGSEVLVGAGTVLSPRAVIEVEAAGGRVIVMPHADLEVIRAAKARDLLALPGIATPTEAFAALDAGADALKLFPAELVQPPVLKAMRAVLPGTARLFPVGGITVEAMAPFKAAGASGFGLGSALYKPGLDAKAVASRARDFKAGWEALVG
ncbi:2-keto-3-deoxy-phosphogalactonate aldolase [Arboricoccus pini]|uniref:2-keto-3-deoxy-phosphogalactonate aldolase n=1 Tax=Arboricoccus pini TaxID=1963835 RepID=A0A212PZK9_9PROT|nr:2-dehydro-3-deoxy-6-phosphogalactonate aldolase [Arboricoccus pini]SNB52460.1 2-keto-3-deoxy-phosphogalactonate aldolase [Arboricoccus pini]